MNFTLQQTGSNIIVRKGAGGVPGVKIAIRPLHEVLSGSSLDTGEAVDAAFTQQPRKGYVLHKGKYVYGAHEAVVYVFQVRGQGHIVKVIVKGVVKVDDKGFYLPMLSSCS